MFRVMFADFPTFQFKSHLVKFSKAVLCIFLFILHKDFRLICYDIVSATAFKENFGWTTGQIDRISFSIQSD